MSAPVTPATPPAQANAPKPSPGFLGSITSFFSTPKKNASAAAPAAVTPAAVKGGRRRRSHSMKHKMTRKNRVSKKKSRKSRR